MITPATQREIFAIIRRIDTNGSAKITYPEFAEFISTPHTLPHKFQGLL